jgi:methylated-DNA-[protein]-cysteine S-methyltransferase
MKKDLFCYHIFETAFGFGAVLFQEDPFLVKRVLLPCKDKHVLIGKLKGKAFAVASLSEQALAFCHLIETYFKGMAICPPWEQLDLGGLTPLQQLVLKTVSAIPFGSTQTYGGIAQRIGRPRACRFVGMTMHRNPFPVAIPCHRVIRADGSLGGFGGGIALKERMLAMEKEQVQHDRRC